MNKLFFGVMLPLLIVGSTQSVNTKKGARFSRRKIVAIMQKRAELIPSVDQKNNDEAEQEFDITTPFKTDFIEEKSEKRIFKYSLHSLQRMRERQISTAAVAHVLKNGSGMDSRGVIKKTAIYNNKRISVVMNPIKKLIITTYAVNKLKSIKLGNHTTDMKKIRFYKQFLNTPFKSTKSGDFTTDMKKSRSYKRFLDAKFKFLSLNR